MRTTLTHENPMIVPYVLLQLVCGCSSTSTPHLSETERTTPHHQHVSSYCFPGLF